MHCWNGKQNQCSSTAALFGTSFVYFSATTSQSFGSKFVLTYVEFVRQLLLRSTLLFIALSNYRFK